MSHCGTNLLVNNERSLNLDRDVQYQYIAPELNHMAWVAGRNNVISNPYKITIIKATLRRKETISYGTNRSSLVRTNMPALVASEFFTPKCNVNRENSQHKKERLLQKFGFPCETV